MNDEMNNINDQNENAEEVIHDEFDDAGNEAENMNQNTTKEESNMNNQNAQNNQNINICTMSNEELKDLQKKINAEQAARVPAWKKWICRIGLGVGVIGAGAGIAYGVKELFFKDEEKTPADATDDVVCGRSWECDVV